MIEPCGRRMSGIGMLRTQAIFRLSMISTEKTLRLIIRNRTERIRGRHNIQQSRCVQPNEKRFTVRRIVGSGNL
jgi:hypothetical protein